MVMYTKAKESTIEGLIRLNSCEGERIASLTVETKFSKMLSQN